jgi:hypothetical protein
MFGGYASPEGLAESEGVDAYGGFGDIDGGAAVGNYTNINAQHQRERARRSAADVAALIDAMNRTAAGTDRRTGQRVAPDITLEQPENSLNLVNFTPARSLIANARNYPGMVNPESDWHDDRARAADPWAGWTGPIFDHTNSIKDMQDMGHGKLSFLAGMIPGVRQMTSLLNSINLHDLGPYMTEEEFNWDDARWEGGANSDFMSNLFTPRHLQINQNPHTTDALAYGNAYNMWEGGDHDN